MISAQTIYMRLIGRHARLQIQKQLAAANGLKAGSDLAALGSLRLGFRCLGQSAGQVEGRSVSTLNAEPISTTSDCV